MDCIFCKIVKGDIPSNKVYEDDKVFAFLDINPTEAGHTLIIPKDHFDNVMELNLDIGKHINKVSKDVIDILDESLNPDGYSLITNVGIAQDVKHYHLHIIPKYKNKRELSVSEVHNKISKVI